MAVFLGGKMLMGEFRHEKLNEAYDQNLVEPPKRRHEGASLFGNCAETYAIIALVSC